MCTENVYSTVYATSKLKMVCTSKLKNDVHQDWKRCAHPNWKRCASKLKMVCNNPTGGPQLRNVIFKQIKKLNCSLGLQAVLFLLVSWGMLLKQKCKMSFVLSSVVVHEQILYNQVERVWFLHRMSWESLFPDLCDGTKRYGYCVQMFVFYQRCKWNTLLIVTGQAVAIF